MSNLAPSLPRSGVEGKQELNSYLVKRISKRNQSSKSKNQNYKSECKMILYSLVLLSGTDGLLRAVLLFEGALIPGF